MIKMKYQELREYVLKSEKFEECEHRKRAPLVHEGFPGTFNLSFTEYDCLKEFNGFSNFHKDLVFSTIQSCVRPQDIDENIRKGNGLWKYLGVFEMADIGGQIILSNKNRTNELHKYQITKLIEILVSLGIDLKRVYPSYCMGGNVSDLTNGKYSFDFVVPEDTLSRDTFVKLGIPEKNLIPDKTRDTLLSLHVNQKTPWGYRCEINYNIGSDENPQLLDIATVERCLWFPKYSGEEVSKNIIGLEPMAHTVSVGGIGLERLYVAVNGIKEVKEVDYIKEFYNILKEQLPQLNETQLFKVGEVIRALHRIYSDLKEHNLTLSIRRKEKKRKFLQIIHENAGAFLNEKILDIVLRKNAEVQPWHNNLSDGIESTKKAICQYLQNFEPSI